MSVAYKLIDGVDSALKDCVVLDVAFLKRNTFGDEALRAEIIGLFLAQLDGVKQQLAFPIDQKTWNFLTHTLTGAASAVGARQIVQLSETWSRCSPPQTQLQRQDYRRQLEDCVSVFKAALKAT